MAITRLVDFIRVAEFRVALHHFLRESDRVTRRHGLTSQRYLLLLMIKGAPDATERSTVGDLSQRLGLAQHTLTELVARAVEAGLVKRTASTEDRRVVHLSLTGKGERALAGSFTSLERERQGLRRLVARIGS